MRIDRRIQKQIEEANREKLSQVEVKDSARLISYGKKDFSSEPSAPTIMWHLEYFRYLLSRIPTKEDVLFQLNRQSQVYRNYSTITGALGGGFNIGIASDGFGRLGLTHIYTTRIMSRSDRTISSSIRMQMIDLPLDPRSSLYSVPTVGIFIKSENSTGKYPNWVEVIRRSGGGGAKYNIPFGIDLQANDWIQLSLFVYAGYSFNVIVSEAFKDISIQFDSWRLNDIDPPSPPTIVDLQSDYIDRTSGTTKNILTIGTPQEDDWLTVGIYRNTPLSRNTTVIAGPGSADMLFSTSVARTDFNRRYTWNVYGAENQDYYFIREDQYLNNIIPNGTMMYSSVHWRHGTYGSNTIKLVRENPYFPPHCIKSSAAYGGGSAGDMFVQSSALPVNRLSNYKLNWFTNTESWTHTSGRNAAIQVSYYTNVTRTACASTPYQLVPWDYSRRGQWVEHSLTIYSNSAWSRLNNTLLTGPSSLSNFIMPRDCRYLDIKFKMLHNSSVKSVIYFDGANLEKDSGQAIVYHNLQSQGTNVVSRDNLSFIESTAFGRFRLPLRSTAAEIYFGHTTVANNGDLYLSSAYWSKFAKGINLSGTYVNEIKNGSFQRWQPSGHQPTSWGTFGTDIASCWPASTAVFGSTSIGIYWHSSISSGWFQDWGIGALHSRVWYTFWAKIDTGQARIGDINRSDINYKNSAWAAISSQTNGKEWNKYSLYLSTAQVFHMASDLKGTRLYVDGIQVETARGFKDAWHHEFDPIRILDGATARPVSYIKSSSNSFTPSNYTVRFWYSPTHRWNTNSSMPRSVLWSCGENATGSRNARTHRIYYVPFTNSNSAGAYFEYYLEDTTPNTIRLRSHTASFDYNEPIHIVATYSSQFGNMSRGKHTKLYINGYPFSSASPNKLFQYPADPLRADHIFIGALKGQETSTAFNVTQDLGTFRFGGANGVFSEFRIDNYVWSPEEVAIDFGANLPRPTRNATLTSIEYKHIADRIRDGSEKETFTYEDFDVEADSIYDYTLDAADYSGNRSVFGDTASITAGDTIAPGPVTSTGASINKSNHVTFYWTNPTDEDFSHCRVYHQHPPYTNFDRVYGRPGTRSTWSMGFIGYGATANIFVRPIDHLGNETPASEVRITARTKKGPLKVIDGSIFTNAGYGLETGLTPLFKATALSWGKIYYTVTNPSTPIYSDLEVRHFVDDSANAGLVVSPIKMSSVAGLQLNTAYHLYFIDSASGRSNALRMRWTLTANIAESVTAYPLGRFFTGNTTVRGYFNPNADVSQFTQGVGLVSPKIESQNGLTYFDLQNSILKNETNNRLEYTQISGAQISYYNARLNKIFPYPRIIHFVPSSRVNCGVSNSFASWGLGPLPNVPTVLYFPERIRTYSTAAGFGSGVSQFLDIQTANISTSAVTPIVRLLTSQKIQTNSTDNIVNSAFAQSSGSYSFPASLGDSWQLRSGYNTAVAWDTATGNQTGFSGIGNSNSTAIARIEVEVSFWSSASPRPNKHINMNWAMMACSAANNIYQDHGAPSFGVYSGAHKGFATNGFLFTLSESRVKRTKMFVKNFTTPGPWKPLIKWIFCSATNVQYGAQAATDISWTSDSYASSGAYFINDMKVEKITYFTSDGSSQEETGTGILQALVIEKGI